MSHKVYWILFSLIILVAFLLRIIPPLGNNFFFTMDQANDAVHVREILHRHQILILGPETNIEGVFAGPLWYYFLATGYAIFNGHPFGGVFMVIILNVTLLGIIMLKIKSRISKNFSLLVGSSLLVSWWFYDISRYAFNPFPLVTICFLLIFSLIDFLEGNEKSFTWGAIFLGLGFNSEVAGTTAMAIFYLIICLFAFLKKRIRLKTILVSIIALSVFLLPQVISEFQADFSQIHSLIKEYRNPDGTFSETNFPKITTRLLIVVSRSSFRQIPGLGIFIFTLGTFFLLKKGYQKDKMHSFSYYFIFLTLTLTLISWLFFSSNKGWRDWHTVYLSPIIFVSFLLTLREVPKKIAVILYTISFLSHISTFQTRYLQYLRPGSDESLLTNEVSALDWVYQKAQGRDFYVYNYLPSVLDYPYQYLFWWYGQKTYGYLPCEYLPYPSSHGLNYPLFVPGGRYYQTPQKNCSSDLRFLIINPDKNNTLKEMWTNELTTGTKLLDKAKIGKIEVEKRLILLKK